MHRVLPSAIQFQCNPDPEPCPIAVDSVQIQQVLINLCVNARDAMPGGGKLTLETRRVTREDLPPAAREELAGQQYVLIRVTDTGSGIDADMLPRIFDPFFTTKPKDMGTGLGLAMVYRIVQAHHGSIEVSSTPGEGTQFDVFLPLQDQPLSAQSTPASPPRVVVVDSQEMISSLLKTLLEQNGYPTTVCRSGKQATEYSATGESPPDVAIVDDNLPDMPGIQCLRSLHASHPTIKGILITANDTTAEPSDQQVRIIREPVTADTIVEQVWQELATTPNGTGASGDIE